MAMEMHRSPLLLQFQMMKCKKKQRTDYSAAAAAGFDGLFSLLGFILRSSDVVLNEMYYLNMKLGFIA